MQEGEECVVKEVDQEFSTVTNKSGRNVKVLMAIYSYYCVSTNNVIPVEARENTNRGSRGQTNQKTGRDM